MRTSRPEQRRDQLPAQRVEHEQRVQHVVVVEAMKAQELDELATDEEDDVGDDA